MDEKLEYAEMLNIPVSTSAITYKPHKKRFFKRKKDGEKAKRELIEKVNGELTENPLTETAETADNAEEKINAEGYVPTVNIERGKKKGGLKVNVIGIEMIAVGVLAAIICLTSALVPSSGINVFFREVFGAKSVETVDERTYEDFTAVLPASADDITLNEGVITINNATAVYSPCDGVVSSLSFDTESATYTMVVKHNDNFKTVITGVDYAYAEIGAAVFSNVPVAYVKDTATLCFTDGSGVTIQNYAISNGAVVWAV